MLADLAVEIVGPVLRLISNFFIEVVVEVMIRGAGFLICRPFSKKVKPEDGVALFVGIAFWAAVVGAGVYYFSFR